MALQVQRPGGRGRHAVQQGLQASGGAPQKVAKELDGESRLRGSERLHFPPPEAQETVTEQVSNRHSIGGSLEWPALLRMLDTVNPTYRN